MAHLMCMICDSSCFPGGSRSTGMIYRTYFLGWICTNPAQHITKRQARVYMIYKIYLEIMDMINVEMILIIYLSDV